MTDWARLEREIVACDRCPRLRAWCEEVARVKRRMFRDESYWGKPVPSFGDRAARILIVGLAPAAHGANRTGRMFTGDDSGSWLYAALHRAGLADRPVSVGRDDGLRLAGTLVTATCRCAPPENRPEPAEIAACAPFLDREIDALDSLRVAVALGQIAWTSLVRRATRVAPASVPSPRPKFGHLAEVPLVLRRAATPVMVLGSYHPSRQNTATGRLTRPMLDAVFSRAVRLSDLDRRGPGPRAPRRNPSDP